MLNNFLQNIAYSAIARSTYMNRPFGQKEEENMNGQKLMQQLEMICEYADREYCKGDEWYSYAGSQESRRFFEEYESQVFIPLVDFDENIEFVSAKKFASCEGKTIFNGDFVRVKKFKSALNGDKYFVYVAPLTVCKTCYRMARNDSAFPC